MSFIVLILWVVATPLSLLLGNFRFKNFFRGHQVTINFFAASAFGKIEDIQNRLCNINTIHSYEER